VIPAAPTTEVVKERFLLEWDQANSSAILNQFEDGRNIYSGLYYTRNLSLDAPKYIAKANGADVAAMRAIPQIADWVALPYLPEFLQANRRQYKVLPRPEKIDGSLCWVVEWPGMDRFWVDPQRGWVIPRRQYCWGPGKPMRFEFRHRDYREVKPGLWLPYGQSEYHYASVVAEKEALWGQVTARCEYTVQSLAFDNVADSFFDVKLPPGTRVLDIARQFRYATSEKQGTDPFAAAIEQATRAKRGILVPWALGGVTLVLVALLVYRIRRVKKLRRSA
jgi:hypothetical protein